MSLSRRELLLGGSAVVAAGAAGALVVSRLGGSDEAAETTGTTATTGAGSLPGPVALVDDEGVRRIGELYREEHPDEDDAAVLAGFLPAFVGMDADQAEEALATLRDQARQELLAGNVVEVDGWVLAVTEARAAALVSLL